MSIIRVGSTEKYASGWESAFGAAPAKKKSTTKKSATKADPKASGKKASTAAPKKKAAKKKAAKKQSASLPGGMIRERR